MLPKGYARLQFQLLNHLLAGVLFLNQGPEQPSEVFDQFVDFLSQHREAENACHICKAYSGYT
jgi:hypothetical protein